MDDGAEPVASGSGVRRLCAALVGPDPGLLVPACQSTRFDRLYLARTPFGAEIAVGPPGLDEMGMLRDLVTAVLAEIATRGAPPGSATLAVHVGIVHVVADGFAGAGLSRVLELAADPAMRRRRGDGDGDGDGNDGTSDCLAVVISDGLYDDLRAEGLLDRGWHPVPGRAARLRRFPTVVPLGGDPL